MKSLKTRVAAIGAIVGLGGLAGLALSAGNQRSALVGSKPLVHTKVIRRTIHVTKHVKPKHPMGTGAGAGVGVYPESGGGIERRCGDGLILNRLLARSLLIFFLRAGDHGLQRLHGRRPELKRGRRGIGKQRPGRHPQQRLTRIERLAAPCRERHEQPACGHPHERLERRRRLRWRRRHRSGRDRHERRGGRRWRGRRSRGRPR